MEYEYTPQKEILARIDRFQNLLQESEVDGALISQNADLFYFTGTVQPSLLFIPAGGEPVLVVQGDLDRVLTESSLARIVHLKKRNKLGSILSDFNYSLRGRIGIEMDVLPARNYLVLCRDFPEANYLDISELVKKVRMIKSEYEISQMRKACEILKQVMHKAQTSIRSGMTELEVDSMMGGLARRLGHQGLLRMRGYNQEMFYAHVFCGKTGTIPSYLKAPLGGLGTTPALAQGASFNKVTANEPLVIDFGVGVNGYVTDMTRTFVIGMLSQELQRAYTFAREVKDFMEQWVKPGRYCSVLYKEVIKLVRQAGYEDNFMGYKDNRVSFVGHGIGLEIDEYPLIAPGFQQEFEENMVFAFEPKLVFPDKGVIGVEDDYLVTGTGVERLTTYDDRVLTVAAS